MSVVITQGSKPVMSSERLVIDATVGGIALTQSVYQTFDSSLNRGKVTAKQAMISVETASIRVSYDPARVPSDSTPAGHIFAIGDIIWLESSTQIKNFRAVRVGGASANIEATYFGE